MLANTERAAGLPPLFGADMVANPYPIYDQLRVADPVHWHEPAAAWIVTRYDDVLAALHDPRLSSDRTGAMQASAGRRELGSFFSFVAKRMVFTDPPQHTRLRGLVSQAFKPHIIQALRPTFRSWSMPSWTGCRTRDTWTSSPTSLFLCPQP